MKKVSKKMSNSQMSTQLKYKRWIIHKLVKILFKIINNNHNQGLHGNPIKEDDRQ